MGTSKPSILDVIKINGRWAQMHSENLLRFLDDLSWARVDLGGSFVLEKSHKSAPVVDLRKQGVYFSPEELEHIRWGPEQAENPYLKQEVRVFGEYRAKRGRAVEPIPEALLICS